MNKHTLTLKRNNKKTVTVICLLLITIIGFWACRKQDVTFRQNEELTLLINKVHKWYDSSLNAKNVILNNQITTLSTNNSVVEPNLNITTLYWDSSYIHYDSADRKGLTVPIYHNKATGEFIQLATINHNNKIKGFLIKTIPDSI